MKFKLMKRGAAFSMGALLLTGPAFASSPPRSAADVPEVAYSLRSASEEATAKLQRLQELAGKLRANAETLESFRTSRLDWETHAHYLNSVRQNVNETGNVLHQLEMSRSSLPLWQQVAIDRVTPAAAQLAARTEDAIEHLTEHRNHLLNPAYSDHLTLMADHAEDMKTTVDSFLEYGEARQNLEEAQQKVERLESQLELSGVPLEIGA